MGESVSPQFNWTQSQIENVWHLESDDEKCGALQCPTLSADEWRNARQFRCRFFLIVVQFSFSNRCKWTAGGIGRLGVGTIEVQVTRSSCSIHGVAHVVDTDLGANSRKRGTACVGREQRSWATAKWQVFPYTLAQHERQGVERHSRNMGNVDNIVHKVSRKCSWNCWEKLWWNRPAQSEGWIPTKNSEPANRAGQRKEMVLSLPPFLFPPFERDSNKLLLLPLLPAQIVSWLLLWSDCF